MRADAWRGGESDGVDFEIGIADPVQRARRSRGRGERDVVFRRRLRPVAVVADRGTQHFDFEFETESPVRVLFTTEPGPAGDYTFDWAYWSNLEIAPIEGD